jgi:hypothetical protein
LLTKVPGIDFLIYWHFQMLTSKIGVLCKACVVGTSALAEFFSILFLSEFSLSFLLGFFAGSLDEAPEMSLLSRTTLA